MTPKHDKLIIDVGMHDGSDTAFYLAKGFDVVAVEAHPDLAEAARVRFANEIAAGRLRILAVAVAEEEGTLSFAIADEASIWSSLSPELIERNVQAGTEYRHVDVPARTFESILAEVGIPRYLKVDIEGYDMLCVRALRAFDARPDFVSIESAVSVDRAEFSACFDELAELWTLGYRRFAYVNQRDNPEQREPTPAAEGARAGIDLTTNHTGLFGNDLPGWQSIGTTVARAQALRLQHNTIGYGGRWTGTLPSRLYTGARSRLGGLHSWYDLHARLDP
jgi:FkbM family methyltransferase